MRLARLPWRLRVLSRQVDPVLDESGAASVVALAIVAAVATVAIAVVPVLGVFVASQEAANAADAAALAAADASSGAVGGEPCELARELAARHGVSLIDCRIDAPVATVRVAATRLGFVLEATARAGPPGWPG